jgi:flagellar basal body-associated protein FliL
MAANEQDGKGGELNKFLIISLVSTVILCVVFAGVNYLVMENLLSQKISKIQVSTEELEEGDGATDEIQRGIIVDLGDFILNLCDEAQKKYLKVNVAIEVSQKETDFPKEVEAPKSGGHGHGAAPAPVDPMEAIQKEMNQFKPAIRDAVITNLSSKTSAELASAAGKELAKEQISNDINSILGGEREVLRVSFGQFIIQ